MTLHGFLFLLFTFLLTSAWGLAIYMPVSKGRIGIWMRQRAKDEHTLARATALALALIGVGFVFNGGTMIRNEMLTARAQMAQEHAMLMKDYMDIDQVKALHYAAIFHDTGDKYLNSPQYKNRAEQIRRYGATKAEFQQAVDIDRISAEAFFERGQFWMATLTLFFSVFTFGIAGGLYSRSMWGKIEKFYPASS